MCLSSETRAWGVINCGEGGRLSGAVILQMIPDSNVEASNSYSKRCTHCQHGSGTSLLRGTKGESRRAKVRVNLPISHYVKGNYPKGLPMLPCWPTVCKGPFIKKVASHSGAVVFLSQDSQMDIFIHLEHH